MFDITVDTPKKFYTFHYDESNNHRKFYIHPKNNAYNVDNDPSRKQAVATNFMLAGVAYKGDVCNSDPENLIVSLGLQATAKELKFNHVASGSFDKVLKSSQIKTIIKWLLDSDLYVHYFALNLEYWAFIDVIDDCVEYCVELNRVVFNNGEHRHKTEVELKDALYWVLKEDKEKFLSVVKEHCFPSILGRESELIKGLHALTVDLHSKAQSKAFQDKRMRGAVNKLIMLLHRSLDINEMTFTHHSEEGELVDGLAIFYQNRGMMFRNSSHIFDGEEIVEADMSKLGVDSSLRSFKYSFVDSKSEPLTQISDVLAGLMAKYFEYIDRNTYEELEIAKSKFSVYQLEALGLIKALIEKSDEECKPFLHYLVSADELRKHNMFMFGRII